jgi:hypothetical protein
MYWAEQETRTRKGSPTSGSAVLRGVPRVGQFAPPCVTLWRAAITVGAVAVGRPGPGVTPPSRWACRATTSPAGCGVANRTNPFLYGVDRPLLHSGS